MVEYYRVVSILEDKIDNSPSEVTRQRWLARYFKVVLPEDQKEKYIKMFAQ